MGYYQRIKPEFHFARTINPNTVSDTTLTGLFTQDAEFIAVLSFKYVQDCSQH